jgi:hypothetical protein
MFVAAFIFIFFYHFFGETFTKKNKIKKRCSKNVILDRKSVVTLNNFPACFDGKEKIIVLIG